MPPRHTFSHVPLGLTALPKWSAVGTCSCSAFSSPDPSSLQPLPCQLAPVPDNFAALHSSQKASQPSPHTTSGSALSSHALPRLSPLVGRWVKRTILLHTLNPISPKPRCQSSRSSVCSHRLCSHHGAHHVDQSNSRACTAVFVNWHKRGLPGAMQGRCAVTQTVVPSPPIQCLSMLSPASSSSTNALAVLDCVGMRLAATLRNSALHAACMRITGVTNRAATGLRATACACMLSARVVYTHVFC